MAWKAGKRKENRFQEDATLIFDISSTYIKAALNKYGVCGSCNIQKNDKSNNLSSLVKNSAF